MSTIDIDRRALQAVRPLELAGYLHAHGWQQVRQLDGKGAVWTHRLGQDEYEILLPLTSELADYLIRLREALNTLALSEGRSLREVWEDVTTTSADVLRVGVVRPDTTDGSLPLRAGIQLDRGLQGLLLAAGCAAVEPAHSFHEPWPARVRDFLGHLRLRRGSERAEYTVTVVSRVLPRLDNRANGAADEEPFERRAFVVLAGALRAAREAAVRLAGGQAGAFDQAVPHGVSTNLCGALAEMGDDLERLGSLRFDFSWAPARPVQNDVPRSVVLPADALAILAEAGRTPIQTTLHETFALCGPIIRAEREQGAASGVVTVRAPVNGRTRRVHVPLARAEFEQALQAFQHVRPVNLVGQLVRSGHRVLLLQARFQEPAAQEAPV
jgi:hypothetical protein